MEFPQSTLTVLPLCGRISRCTESMSLIKEVSKLKRPHALVQFFVP